MAFCYLFLFSFIFLGTDSVMVDLFLIESDNDIGVLVCHSDFCHVKALCEVSSVMHVHAQQYHRLSA